MGSNEAVGGAPLALLLQLRKDLFDIETPSPMREGLIKRLKEPPSTTKIHSMFSFVGEYGYKNIGVSDLNQLVCYEQEQEQNLHAYPGS